MRTTDCAWLDLLQRTRHGECHEDLKTILDQRRTPWSEAVFVTPQHAVRMKWNSMTVGRQLNLEEKVALATKPKKGSRNKQHEHHGLPMKWNLHLA